MKWASKEKIVSEDILLIYSEVGVNMTPKLLDDSPRNCFTLSFKHDVVGMHNRI